MAVAEILFKDMMAGSVCKGLSTANWISFWLCNLFALCLFELIKSYRAYLLLVVIDWLKHL